MIATDDLTLWLWLTDAMLLAIAFLAGRLSVKQQYRNNLEQLERDISTALKRIDILEDINQ